MLSKGKYVKLAPVKDFYLSVMIPMMKLMYQHYDKLTAPDRERQKLLRVPSCVEDSQRKNEASSLYVMSSIMRLLLSKKAWGFDSPGNDLPSLACQECYQHSGHRRQRAVILDEKYKTKI